MTIDTDVVVWHRGRCVSDAIHDGRAAADGREGAGS